MRYHILTGEQLNENYIGQIHELDKRAYTKENSGELNTMILRHKMNEKTFICVADENNKIIAYINFFPVSYSLYDYLINKATTSVDDEIAIYDYIDENLCYSFCKKEKPVNNIFILSVVNMKSKNTIEAINKNKILTKDEEIDCKIVSSLLQNAFHQYLNSLELNGFYIKTILAVTVSKSGQDFAKRNGLKKIKEFSDKNILYEKKGGFLENV